MSDATENDKTGTPTSCFDGFSINEGFDFRRRFPWLQAHCIVRWSRPRFARMVVCFRDRYLVQAVCANR